MNQNDFEIQASGLGYVGPWVYDNDLVEWKEGFLGMSTFIYIAGFGATMENYSAETLNMVVCCIDMNLNCRCGCMAHSGVAALMNEVCG